MDSLTARLAALDTCAVSDALDKLGLPGAVIGLSALTGPAKVAGRVVTTKLGAPLPGLPQPRSGTRSPPASGWTGRVSACAIMRCNPGRTAEAAGFQVVDKSGDRADSL